MGHQMIPVYYTSHRRPPAISKDEVAFVLTRDKWDDFGYETTFWVYRVDQSGHKKLGSIRLLIEGNNNSSSVLGELPPSNNYDGVSLTSLNRLYISLGLGLDFYRSLVNNIGYGEMVDLLATIHDVAYLESRSPHHPSLALRRDKGFGVSLLRGDPSVEAYGTARRVIFNTEMGGPRYGFSVQFRLDAFSSDHQLTFDFSRVRDVPVPTNIYALIGKNGSGKSQALKYIAAGLSFSGHDDLRRIQPEPEFKKVVGVSFSPFNVLPLKRSQAGRGVIPYEFCGLENIATSLLDEHFFESTCVQYLRAMLRYDNNLPAVGHSRFNVLRPKIPAVMRALGSALGYSDIFLPLPEEYPPHLNIYSKKIGDLYYLDFLAASENGHELAEFLETYLCQEQLAFEKRDSQEWETYLSAGQKMFVLLVLGIAATIERDSLLLIDEPELYLHPNLEVAFMSTIKVLTSWFESYAIISTHSLFFVREIPSRCVLVFDKSKDGQPVIQHPSIPTYAANVSDLANVVFSNIDADKPSQQLLREIAKNLTNIEEVFEKYSEYINLVGLSYLRSRIAIARREQNDESQSDSN